MSTAIDVAVRAASPLIDRGYVMSDGQTDEQYFGSGWVLLERGDARVRVVNDRGQWFVELGSAAAPDEWFDARLVLNEIDAKPPDEGTDEAALEALCTLLAETSPRWEVLFLGATFTTARRSLRKREIELAREQFGVDM
jgi:hypothetical protein